jgi:outer membrane protein OmpA-like peptidoglycan-associated protein
MKNFFITICFFIATTSILGQNSTTQKADQYFNQYEYVNAANAYLKIVDNGKADGYVYKQLADSYFNMFNTTEAIKWYAKAVQSAQDAETYYRYAQMLKANVKYEEANKQMLQFANKAPNDQRAKTFKENPNYIPKLFDVSKLYEVKSGTFNTDKTDFGAVLNNNTIYFTSTRNNSRKDYGWNKEPYLDLYKADFNSDKTITNVSNVTELNSKYHDGPATISADGNTMYFASDSFRESSFEKDSKNKLKLGRNNIFRAVNTGGNWNSITSLSFNSSSYSTSNPCISSDGKTLYFSSDIPGSIGGVDIWKVSINGDNTYGKPENLGSKVNTEGNESFPFIAEDNITLYFASSGKPGLGGLDIFKIDLSKSEEAQNMGKPINTEKDDFAFTYNKTQNIGFLSSNRNGNDDIYEVHTICNADIVTVVTNAKTGAILTNTSVSIVDDKKNIIVTEVSNSKGEVTYKVDCDKSYAIVAAKDGFESNTIEVAKSNGGMITIPIALQPIDVIITETEIILKPIFFEYNKSNITREGAYELDKLVQVLKSNDQLIILAKAHTDNRGGDAFNLSLSDRRAKATAQYVISKGIQAYRISGKGMGESEPKVDCKENCTEEEHAQNRRSEFLIVK